MQSLDSRREPGRLIWLTKMYHAYAADLQRYIYSKVGDPFLAEDLTSTVFLKALRWLRQDQSEESARGWLYETARTSIADSSIVVRHNGPRLRLASRKSLIQICHPTHSKYLLPVPNR